MFVPVTTQPRSTIERCIAFYTVGTLGMGVQLATVWILTEWGGFHYLASTALGVEVAILHNFLWHERWTWADRTTPAGGVRHSGGLPPALGRMVRFNLTNGLVSIWGNVAFTAFFVSVCGTSYLVGNLLAIAACSIMNFLVADKLVFATEVSR